jgi:hypothetical protein
MDMAYFENNWNQQLFEAQSSNSINTANTPSVKALGHSMALRH